MRPATLAEVALRVRAGDSFDLALREFLDEMQAPQGARDPRSRISEEPPSLAEAIARGDVMDAYLAATAESLADAEGWARPAWVHEPRRALRHPWFALPWAGMRALLLLESPAAFRARNLFVSANALTRA